MTSIIPARIPILRNSIAIKGYRIAVDLGAGVDTVAAGAATVEEMIDSGVGVAADC